MNLLESRAFVGLAYGLIFLSAAAFGQLPLWVLLAVLFGLSVGEAGKLLAGEDSWMPPASIGWLALVFLSIGVLRGWFGGDVAVGFLCAAFVFDTASYFGGRALAGPKLVPSVSPGKTVSGAVAGLLCVLILSPWLVPGHGWAVGLVFAAILAALFLAGDLMVSVFKRRARVKDTGTILGAHGGILDRVDSLLLAAPVYWLMLVSAG